MCVCMCVCSSFLISALNALSRCVVFRQCTCQDVSSSGRESCVCVCVLYVLSFGNAPVKMCCLWAGGLVCVCVCVLFFCALNALSRCVIFRQCTCQDVSSSGRGPCVCVCLFYIICALNALLRCVVFRQGVLCVCVCACVLYQEGNIVPSRPLKDSQQP